jgi:hypothetical protein
MSFTAKLNKMFKKATCGCKKTKKRPTKTRGYLKKRKVYKGGYTYVNKSPNKRQSMSTSSSRSRKRSHSHSS